eukprot:6200713-Prymnesium_polylepis.1
MPPTSRPMNNASCALSVLLVHQACLCLSIALQDVLGPRGGKRAASAQARACTDTTARRAALPIFPEFAVSAK